MSTPIKVVMSYCSNHEEMEEANRLGYDRPDPIFEKGERYIFKEHVMFFNQTDDEGIRIDFVSGDSMRCDFSESAWKALTF